MRAGVNQPFLHLTNFLPTISASIQRKERGRKKKPIRQLCMFHITRIDACRVSNKETYDTTYQKKEEEEEKTKCARSSIKKMPVKNSPFGHTHTRVRLFNLVCPLGSLYPSFQPWKTCAINPFLSLFFSLYFYRYLCVCVYVCVCVCVVDWDVRVRTERVSVPSSMAWYRVVSIGRHAAWGSLRSGFVTPQSARWWMRIVAIGCCVRVYAPTTHSHLSQGS